MNEMTYGDYTENFSCPDCGSPIDVYIDWTDGGERPRCRKGCTIDLKWYCDKKNGGE